MPDGEVWENEVAGGGRTLEIGHASNVCASQGQVIVGRLGGASLSKRTCVLERSKEAEVGSIGQGDVGLVCFVAFIDVEVDDGRRVDGTSVCGSWSGCQLKLRGLTRRAG